MPSCGHGKNLPLIRLLIHQDYVLPFRFHQRHGEIKTAEHTQSKQGGKHFCIASTQYYLCCCSLRDPSSAFFWRYHPSKMHSRPLSRPPEPKFITDYSQTPTKHQEYEEEKKMKKASSEVGWIQQSGFREFPASRHIS